MDKKVDVRYLNKDFTDFRKNLINLAKTYYKDTINDFSSADPAMMFVDMASYVGDVLSYYMDVTLKEMMLIHASEKKNVLALAQSLGYKPMPNVPAIVTLTVYQQVPAIGTGTNVAPDLNYALNIKSGMEVMSSNGVKFRTTQRVNFAQSSSVDPLGVTIYSVDDSGVPTYYLLQKYVSARAGTQKSTTFTFDDPIRYNKVNIAESNVISIDLVTDSDDNIWYEVPYLAQDTIFDEIPNTSTYTTDLYQYYNTAPYLLKIKRVPKRFITRYKSDGTMDIQFGAGVTNDYDEEIIPNPDNVGLSIPTGVSKLNYSWDIANFLYSDAYGQVPQNTTLTVKYSIGGGITSNAPVNSIRKIIDVPYDNFISDGLNGNMVSYVKDSLAVNNIEAASGGRDMESVEEIRNNALAYFAAQGRTVTKDDYILRTYTMDPKFGAIAKAYIVQDEQLNLLDLSQRIKNPFALNLYILSYDDNKRLVNASQTIKKNLSTYLDRYRMITDSINIKNAFVINIGVQFEITVLPDYQSNEVLLYCINELKTYFNIDNWQISQPIVIADIIRTIANVKGVQSLLNLRVYNLFDEDLGYVPNVYDIDSSTNDGIILPSMDPSIFEVRYPEKDIKGAVRSY